MRKLTGAPRPSIFLSYARTDASRRNEVVGVLNDFADVWVDVRHLSPAAEWRRETLEAVANWASGRIDFDKNTQRFDATAASRLLNLADPHGRAHTTVAAFKTETLTSSLLTQSAAGGQCVRVWSGPG